MTVYEFVNKYNGKKVDFDGYGGAQCVDLARQFIKEGLGVSEHTGVCATSGGAKDLFLDYDRMPVEKKYFNRISKSKCPKPGDLMVWGATKTNSYGHVAIVVGMEGGFILVFEQDGFAQNGARLVLRTFDNSLGVLRFNGRKGK